MPGNTRSAWDSSATDTEDEAVMAEAESAKVAAAAAVAATSAAAAVAAATTTKNSKAVKSVVAPPARSASVTMLLDTSESEGEEEGGEGRVGGGSELGGGSNRRGQSSSLSASATTSSSLGKRRRVDSGSEDEEEGALVINLVSPKSTEAAATNNGSGGGWMSVADTPPSKRSRGQGKLKRRLAKTYSEEEESEEEEEAESEPDTEEYEPISARELKIQGLALNLVNTCDLALLKSLPFGQKAGVAEGIIASRPWTDWDTAFHVISSVADKRTAWAAYDIAEEREVASQLLNECESITAAIRGVLDESSSGDSISSSSSSAGSRGDGNDGGCSEIASAATTSASAASTGAQSVSANAVAAATRAGVPQPRCMVQEPRLKPYQRVGLNWLALLHRQDVNAVLADEMGLGKTVQAIAFIAHLYELHQGNGSGGGGSAEQLSSSSLSRPLPSLVVVPSSTYDNWQREFAKWCPTLRVAAMAGLQAERFDKYQQLRRKEIECDVALSTYSCVSSTEADKRYFFNQKFGAAIFDEGHMLKNMKSKRYRDLMRIQAMRRVLLTGTPLQNDLLELISLVSFIMPHVFNHAGTNEVLQRMFKRSGGTGSKKSGGGGSADGVDTGAGNDKVDNVFGEKVTVAQVKRIIAPFMLRRLKTNVLDDLPPKTITTLHCDMVPRQRKVYDRLVSEYRRERAKNEAARAAGAEPPKRILSNLLMHLRKAANHPLLHRDIFDDTIITEMSHAILNDPKYATCSPAVVREDMEVMTDWELQLLCQGSPALVNWRQDTQALLRVSGKSQKLLELLAERRKQGKKVLVFSQFTMVLDLLGQLLADEGHKMLRLDGSTTVAERQGLMDEFTSDKSIGVFLLSTRAGGLGINLLAAECVIIHDIDFNPWNDKQAEDRCHRVGQTKPVEIVRLITRNSVEELMDKRAQQKLQLEAELGAGKVEANDEGFMALLKASIDEKDEKDL
eukprot:UC1_evm1s1807